MRKSRIRPSKSSNRASYLKTWGSTDPKKFARRKGRLASVGLAGKLPPLPF